MKTAERPSRPCANCGGVIPSKRHDAAFCGPPCRTAFHRRQSTRGQVAIPIAMAWRGARNRTADKEVGRHAMMELCRVLDAWAAEDREAGRPSVMSVMSSRLARTGAMTRD